MVLQKVGLGLHQGHRWASKALYIVAVKAHAAAVSLYCSHARTTLAEGTASSESRKREGEGRCHCGQIEQIEEAWHYCEHLCADGRRGSC